MTTPLALIDCASNKIKFMMYGARPEEISDYDLAVAVLWVLEAAETLGASPVASVCGPFGALKAEIIEEWNGRYARAPIYFAVVIANAAADRPYLARRARARVREDLRKRRKAVTGKRAYHERNGFGHVLSVDRDSNWPWANVRFDGLPEYILQVDVSSLRGADQYEPTLADRVKGTRSLDLLGTNLERKSYGGTPSSVA